MTAQLSPTPIFKGWANDGTPLAFGKLFSYVAGTSTKQATYTDYTQSVPNSNPIILNARGEAQVWLDPTLNYKLTLAPANDTDPPTNPLPLWPVDHVNVSLPPTVSIVPAADNTYTLGTALVSWANGYFGPNHAPIIDPTTGNIGYWSRTTAEIAAAVTPSNFSYAAAASWAYIGRYNGSLAIAATVAAVSPFTIFIDQPLSLSANLTLPASCALIFIGAGSVSVAGTFTLTVKGPVYSQFSIQSTFIGGGTTVLNGPQVFSNAIVTGTPSGPAVPVLFNSGTATPTINLGNQGGITTGFSAIYSNSFVMTLTSNLTTLIVSNMVPGQRLELEIIQDATGGRTLTNYTGIKFPAGVVPTLSVGANARDLLRVSNVGGTLLGDLTKAYA